MPGRLDHKPEVHAATSNGAERDRALSEERYYALQRHIPLMYGSLLINLLGLHVVSGKAILGPRSPATALGLLVLFRLVHWLGKRGELLAIDKIESELRKVVLIGGVFCASFCVLSLLLFQHASAEQRSYIVLFSGLAAISCSYGLSSHPRAARLPIYLVAVPLAGRLLFEDNVAHLGMGISLFVLSAITMRSLAAQDRVFTRLVHSRFDVEAERERAVVAEEAAQAEKLRANELAETDSLTGLSNRRAFLRAVTAATARKGTVQAVALLDLDGFKPINDTYGHGTGDSLLIQVSERLKSLAVGQAHVARLGGDEFAFLFECPTATFALSFGRRAADVLASPFELDGRVLSITACCGVALQEDDAEPLEQTIRKADIALYSAKRSGRASVELFSAVMDAELQRSTAIEQAMRAPDIRDNIRLAYQPILDLETMELRSFEALARWRHSELGWIPPSEFIPITERMNLIEGLTEGLLERAAEDAGNWPNRVQLSFNLSAVQLCSEGSAENILSILERQGFSPSRLCIEVTETALLADFNAARRNLARLRAHGVGIVLDDFGAGFASISYLREIRFDSVKLDGSLVTAASANGAGLALLRGVLGLCEAVGVTCVAEHIETDLQLRILRDLGCRFGQGFGLARPMDSAAAFATTRSKVIPFRNIRRTAKFGS